MIGVGSSLAVITIDANVRVGSVGSLSFGTLEAVEENDNGNRGRKILGSFSPLCHSYSAQSRHTWFSSEGTSARVDYIRTCSVHLPFVSSCCALHSISANLLARIDIFQFTVHLSARAHVEPNAIPVNLLPHNTTLTNAYV